jgi:KUP system potassium uptake protein
MGAARAEHRPGAMHLNANLPAAYFGVPTAQVVEVGLEVEI